MGFLTNEDIEKRKVQGIKMNRLDCGWNLPATKLAETVSFINQWTPTTDTEKRDKHILQLAFVEDMNCCQIARLNDPVIVGMGNRNRGKPLTPAWIYGICVKYVPAVKNTQDKNTSKTKKIRNELFKKQLRHEIKKVKICSTCGGKDDLELHHIVPVSKGGTNDYYNLIYLCHSCHMKLHHNLYDVFK